jgi:Ca-activated chloride channel homolog
MKKVNRGLVAVIAVVAILFWTNAFSEGPDKADKTLSPYFFVVSGDSVTDRLPLKATTAAVNISGVMADVLVTQVYKNEGKKALEAIYIFPASTRAAVYGMKMTIGKRIIEAKIKKRDEAREVYEQAKAAGKSASLLEQQRPNVFQMNVANIMPGDEIKVELKYTELLVPTDRIYEFVYPTVVGPRYCETPISETKSAKIDKLNTPIGALRNPAQRRVKDPEASSGSLTRGSNTPAAGAAPSEKWVENPYLHQGELSATKFDISVTISAGLPIRDLACTSHKVNSTYNNLSTVKVSLDKSEIQGGNRDYILRYRLAGDKIQTGLLLFQGEKENFFVLMMQPPKRITNANIPGREYIFIVDVSGSMYGFPLEISKKLLKNLIRGLRSTDCFNVLLFSGGSSLMSETSVPATADNIQKAIYLIERQHGGGGTELLPALKRALSLKKPENYSRTIVMATDGYVTVEEEVFDLIRNNLGNANMFTFGIGTAVNRYIIEGMAHVGLGEAFVIEKQEKAEAEAARFRNMIQSPVLTQVKVDFDGFQTYDVEPIAIPDVLAERPVLVFGKWRGKAQGTITLSGITGEGKYSQTLNVGDFKPEVNNTALKYLWARQRIMLLSDYNMLRSDDKRIKEVTDLGLTYNLLTAYTSFVAVDSEIRNKGGKLTTVKQPLPLPEGVSDYAVGGYNYPSSPAMHQGYMPRMAMKAKSGPHLAYDTSRAGGSGYAVEEKKEVQTASTITISDLTVSKGQTKEDVHKFFQTHLSDLEKCLAGLNAKGEIKLELTINTDGSVKNISVVSGTISDASIQKCIMDQMKKWLLPKVTTGKTAEVTVTFKM